MGSAVAVESIVTGLDAIDIRTIGFDSATHAVATSSRRTFTGALRAIIQVRDRHCQHPPSCDQPIDRCDIDHITAWACGGTTSQDNGRLLCQFHNRIQPQHTRPPARPDEHGDGQPFQIELAELLWPSTPRPDGEWRIYEIDYAELLPRGP